MTVEMTEPFAWPEDNSTDPAFGKESLEDQEQDSDEIQKKMSSTADTNPPSKDHAAKMREQAHALLSRKKQWAPPCDVETLRPFTFARR
jgi:hypothetical protein